MKSKLINEKERVFMLVFDTGDEVIEGLTAFAETHQIRAASFTAIGAFKEVTLGWFDLEKKDYKKNPIDEQVEVVSLVGNVALNKGTLNKGTLNKGKPKIHAHVVVGKSDGTAYGGHLLSAHVRPTLEVVMQATPDYLRREMDPETGLPLLNPDL